LRLGQVLSVPIPAFITGPPVAAAAGRDDDAACSELFELPTELPGAGRSHSLLDRHSLEFVCVCGGVGGVGGGRGAL
jgi:hypothetical protein